MLHFQLVTHGRDRARTPGLAARQRDLHRPDEPDDLRVVDVLVTVDDDDPERFKVLVVEEV